MLPEWLTPDLLAKVAGSPILQSGISNPRFMAAIAELQKDPRAALQKFKASLTGLNRFIPHGTRDNVCIRYSAGR